jgi:DNA-binding LacI/PurR family transcriptional regulator
MNRNFPQTWQRVTDRGARRPIYWRNEYQRTRGETLQARYDNYRAAMEALGIPAVDFDTWLNT